MIEEKIRSKKSSEYFNQTNTSTKLSAGHGSDTVCSVIGAGERVYN